MNKFVLKICIRIFTLLVMISAADIAYGQNISSEFRTVPDSVKTSFRNDKEYAYANDPAYWKKDKPVNNTRFLEHLVKVMQSQFIRLIVYLLLLAVFIFVAYRIFFVLGVFDRFAGRSGKKQVDDELSANSQADLVALIQQAISNGDLRLATRYHFLHLLKILSDKKLIQLHSRATNRDYINQVNGSSFATSFKTLTTIYEYVWYGERQVSTEQYKFIDQNFMELKSTLHP